MKVCIVGASGKLGQYMVGHALDRGYEVVAVCRKQSVGKLDRFKGRITVVPGDTDQRDVIRDRIGLVSRHAGPTSARLTPSPCIRQVPPSSVSPM